MSVKIKIPPATEKQLRFVALAQNLSVLEIMEATDQRPGSGVGWVIRKTAEPVCTVGFGRRGHATRPQDLKEERGDEREHVIQLHLLWHIQDPNVVSWRDLNSGRPTCLGACNYVWISGKPCPPAEPDGQSTRQARLHILQASALGLNCRTERINGGGGQWRQ
ncbi:hypothetical protein DPEC_G00367610 [Dallia pectoralis]|nr:hypothetical protein DPEC_G00367610 [Dallia pectoralis]